LAPVVLAFVIERLSDRAGLTLAAGFTVLALGCMVAIRRPAARS
jgi:fucose permease